MKYIEQLSSTEIFGVSHTELPCGYQTTEKNPFSVVCKALQCILNHFKRFE